MLRSRYQRFADAGAESRTPRRATVLALACFALTSVVLFEWYSRLDFSLGVFYVFPVLIAATVLDRWQVVAAAALCAYVRAFFTPGLPPIEYWLRFAMAVLAFSGAGLLVGEINRHQRTVSASLARLQLEQQMRRRAEDQLRTLAESSPAAILTLNGDGCVVAANRAAHELLGFDPPNSLIGVSIAEYVPLFAGALRLQEKRRFMRTSAYSWAKRSNGTQFPVASWFSTYSEGNERFLAGILVDTSEEVRDRERENFKHLYYNNRLFASSVSHEIRNLCMALRVVTSNLRRRPDMKGAADFEALNTLVENLARISSINVRQSKDVTAAKTDIRAVLDQLRVVIEPDWTDADGQIIWAVEDRLPQAHADFHALIQVLLNLSLNSLRAVQDRAERVLRIEASHRGDRIAIDVRDTGCGVPDPAHLFQPFHAESSGTGLGLYISRNLVRSFGGELSFVPSGSGAHFRIQLATFENAAAAS